MFEGSTILGVGSGGSVPDGAAVIDLPGATLLPGEAHRLGLPVTAHAHAVAAIADAVAAGVDGLEHASFWTEDGVDAPTRARVASSSATGSSVPAAAAMAATESASAAARSPASASAQAGPPSALPMTRRRTNGSPPLTTRC